MKTRTARVSASIADAVAAPDQASETTRGLLARAVGAVVSFLAIYQLGLTRHRPRLFLHLRRDLWELDEDGYRASFGARGADDASPRLVPAGDLGYSGSTFFATPDGAHLVKSLPRRSESDFFARDLLDAYAAHAAESPDSLLVRVLDLVRAPRLTLGGLLGTAPTHHVVMENLTFRGPRGGAGRVETYDLKPDDYFFPERDVADGRLAPDGVKDRLVDSFPGRVRVSAADRDRLLSLLAADTALLAGSSAVDYSLFLVRFASTCPDRGSPFADGSWRTGVDSTDGRWTYRALVLDFFWAKKKLRAKAMTALIDAFNLLADKGPMSITAQPAEYRARFLRMVDKLVVATDDGDDGQGSVTTDDA